MENSRTKPILSSRKLFCSLKNYPINGDSLISIASSFKARKRDKDLNGKENKMSHCISRFTVPHPLASPSQTLRADQSCPLNFPKLVAVRNGGRRGISSMAADGRDGLDQLQQRSIKSQPRRRSSPAVAPLGLWDRFPTARTVQQMLETMDRLMEDPMAYNGRWSSSSPSSSSSLSSAPQENGGGLGFGRGRTPWEIKECESEYKMRFDMPGMTKEDVKVWVQEKMLVLRAEKVGKKKKMKKSGEEEGEDEDEEEEWPASGFGRYGTRIALPENVEFEKIRAEVRDGVLYVTIPKASPTAKVFDISVD